MKTTSFILAALLFSTGLVLAQSNDKPVTVRIKKIENINGVEKITDSTYTVKGPITLSDGLNMSEIEMEGKNDGRERKMVLITDQIDGDVPNSRMITNEEMKDDQVQRAIKIIGLNGNKQGIDQILMMDVNDVDSSMSAEKKCKKMVIIKTIKLTEPSAEDSKLMRNQKGDGKLEVENLNFYPNPTGGKFNLTFSLPNKGDADISIFDSAAKTIFSEKLPAFSGECNKEINISQHPKGIYFVKLSQNGHTQIKKVVLE